MGGRRLKATGEQDEELADLQRRFTALEDEARNTVPTAAITPKSTMRTQRDCECQGQVSAC